MVHKSYFRLTTSLNSLDIRVFLIFIKVFVFLFSADVRSLPDVAMTGTCSQECSELGHSDACWMPGQPSPARKARTLPKLSTFVPYQERGGGGTLGRLANGEPRPRLPPSRSAYAPSDHTPSDHVPMEEVPLSVTSEFPPTSPTSNHAPKREIYL